MTLSARGFAVQRTAGLPATSLQNKVECFWRASRRFESVAVLAFKDNHGWREAGSFDYAHDLQRHPDTEIVINFVARGEPSVRTREVAIFI